MLRSTTNGRQWKWGQGRPTSDALLEGTAQWTHGLSRGARLCALMRGNPRIYVEALGEGKKAEPIDHTKDPWVMGTSDLSGSVGRSMST